jgi:hypothetical protein
MNNVTMKMSGWLGTGVADLARSAGPATLMVRPRHGWSVVFGDGAAVRRHGVLQLA